MEPFSDFLEVLKQIDDPRRAEGKLYDVAHVLLFTIFAMLAGANSYRQAHAFIHVHFRPLRDLFGLKWKRAPAYTSIRGIITKLDPGSIERVLRRHAAALARDAAAAEHPRHVAMDGKALRHSFDRFTDRKAAHILGAFATGPGLVLGHIECDEKSNEIPALQSLVAELGIVGAIVTADAMHCQKNLRGGRPRQGGPDRPGESQSARAS
jgi:hypothetical protein